MSISVAQYETLSELYPLWDPTIPFPSHTEMPELAIVTHISVEKAQPEGYHYLHESSIAWHHGILYAGWANHRLEEVNVKNELIRGSVSTDGGFTWSQPTTWVEAPVDGGESFNHPVITSHADRLWGFFTRWENEKPGVAIFTLDEATGCWDATGARIPGFLPFRPPMQMADGNWIMSGEHHWHEAAVAISHGDDWTRWDMVEIPRNGIELLFPETTLMEQEDQLLAIMRPLKLPTAPISVSKDCGRTWSPMQLSTFPMAWSQPYCGRLSTGQQYLISNDREKDRTLLSIAVTLPGESLFTNVWAIRHQQYPVRRLFGGWGGGSQVGKPTEWSYPSAVEYEGKLYISYTQGKEDCVLSIIPLSALQAS